MTLSPITLQEARDHLQLEESDGHDDDEELWGTVLAAVGLVEGRVGAIRPREVTSRVRCDRPSLRLPKHPILTISTISDASGTSHDPAAWFVSGSTTIQPLWSAPPRSPFFDVTYVTGRVPIPEDLMEAVKLQAGLLWASQRGPSASSRFQAIGGDGISSPAGVDRKRLEDIISLHKPVLAA